MASKIVVDRVNEVEITPVATGATITLTDEKTLTVSDDTTLGGGTHSGTNTGDETATTLGTKISSADAKTTPVDADVIGLSDSAASNILKKLSWANIKSTLKTYFDTLYSLAGHVHAAYMEKASNLSDVADAATARTNLGLGSTDSPTHVTVKLTGLTDGYIPYHQNDSNGLINGPLFTDGTKVLLGDTANAKSTQGLTINQGANDDEILSLKSSDVAHPMTGITEADTYFEMTKYGSTAGGVSMFGLTDADTTTVVPFQITGIFGCADPNNNYPAVNIRGGKTNGGTSWTTLADTDMLFQVANVTDPKFNIAGDGRIGIGALPQSSVKVHIEQSAADSQGLVIKSTAGTGQSYGARIDAGSNSTDVSFWVRNKSGSSNYFYVRGDGLVYVDGEISAGTVTDRTPFYEGDALAEIKKIKGVNGQIDHASLPDFARRTTIHPIHEEQEVEIEVENEEKGKVEKQIVKQPVKVGERIEEGRDIGAMISILTVAVQQLLTRVEAIENKNK